MSIHDTTNWDESHMRIDHTVATNDEFNAMICDLIGNDLLTENWNHRPSNGPKPGLYNDCFILLLDYSAAQSRRMAKAFSELYPQNGIAADDIQLFSVGTSPTRRHWVALVVPIVFLDWLGQYAKNANWQNAFSRIPSDLLRGIIPILGISAVQSECKIVTSEYRLVPSVN